MKLTGKCKEDFLEHCKQSESFMDTYAEIYLNALTIEFLDTKQYYGKPLFQSCFEIYWKYKTSLQSFNDVCIQAIEKANTIYNEN